MVAAEEWSCHSPRRRWNFLRLVRCASLRTDAARRWSAPARSGCSESEFPESFYGRRPNDSTGESYPDGSRFTDSLYRSKLDRPRDEPVQAVSTDDELPVSTWRALAARSQSQHARARHWSSRSDGGQYHEYRV